MKDTIIDTPEGIEMYRLMAIRSALGLEIKTGLRHSRNAAFIAAKQITGKKTRQACYTIIDDMITAKHRELLLTNTFLTL